MTSQECKSCGDYGISVTAGMCSCCRMAERIAELESELAESARLHGIGGSMEARLLAQVAELEAKYIAVVDKFDAAANKVLEQAARISALGDLLKWSSLNEEEYKSRFKELEAALDDARNTRLAIKLVRAEEENVQLREALEWYASAENWHSGSMTVSDPILEDGGKKAREALGQVGRSQEQVNPDNLALRAEIARLREALQTIVDTPVTRSWAEWELKIKLAADALKAERESSKEKFDRAVVDVNKRYGRMLQSLAVSDYEPKESEQVLNKFPAQGEVILVQTTECERTGSIPVEPKGSEMETAQGNVAEGFQLKTGPVGEGLLASDPPSSTTVHVSQIMMSDTPVKPHLCDGLMCGFPGCKGGDE